MATLKEQIAHEEKMSRLGANQIYDSIANLTDNNPIVQKLITHCFEQLEKGIIEEIIRTNDSSGPTRIISTIQESGLKGSFEKKKVGDDVESVRMKMTPDVLSFLTLRVLFVEFQHKTAESVNLFNGAALTVIGHRLGVMINDAIIDRELDHNDQTRLGITLLTILSCQIPEWFLIEKKFLFPNDKYDRTVLEFTEEFQDLVSDNIEELAFFSNIKTPMIFKPVPWTDGHEGGGYYTEPFQRTLIKKNRQRGINEDIVNGVNAIQESPWKIDLENLEIIRQTNKSVPKTLDKFYPHRPPKHGLKKPRPKDEDGKYILWDDLSEDQKTVYRNYNAAHDFYTKNCQAKLSKDLSRTNSFNQADDFKKYSTIYFPHDCDYRGRIYNISQSGLSTQGDGVQKGLLQFRSDRPIETQSGENWLKYNIANHCGEDKLPLDKKIVWVDERVDFFRKVISDPLKYTEWHSWDKPLEGLQSVREYLKYLDDPRQNINVHVQLDG